MEEIQSATDGLGRGAEKTDVVLPDPPPRRRSVGRDAEPLLVDLAWLVIEGAVLFRRLRGILARIKGGPR